ncbi:MAG: hypothetical protein HY679_00755 [Chloroflexi bacterium]|nr:hypothetical protein [Chloroflexota bacterium]
MFAFEKLIAWQKAIDGLMKATVENEQGSATGSWSLRESPMEYGIPDTPD